MNILIRADSSSFIGTGHIMRDLVLAKQYKTENIIFAVRELAGNINYKIDEAGYSKVVLNTNDFDFGTYFTLYPNPAKDVLNFEVKNEIGVKSVSVYNTLGQIVMAITNVDNLKSIDVSSLTAGSYFVKVYTDKGSSSSKFIKQ